MNGKLKVSTKELRNSAKKFETSAGTVKKLTNEMTSIVNKLNGQVYSGDAASAYKNKFKGLSDDMEKLYKMIKEHVSDLNQMANEYDKTENDNVSTAKSLTDDTVI